MGLKQFFTILVLLCYFQLSFTLNVEPATTLAIPMRDGTTLPTDIYLPDENAQDLPCILLRCPAGRKAEPWVNYAALSTHGFVVAIQDTRSALDKEGKTFPFYDDAWGENQDGHDTVEWLAKHPLTNGKIGTIGFSACGITQLLLAPTTPQGLKCQYIGIAAGSFYHHAIYPGGQLLKNQVEGWLGLYAKDESILKYVVNNPYYNAFWKGLDSVKMAHQVNVPGFLYGGWYDTFIQGTIDAFVARQTQGAIGAKGKQKLLIGPWTHYWPLSTKLGDFNVPAQAMQPPYNTSPERWFNHYLKGEDNGVEDLPNIIYYVMGPFDGSRSSGNVWRTTDEWPVPAVDSRLYLNTNGHLSIHSPQKSRKFCYEYDPLNPVPTLGGRNLFLESGPKDQSLIEKRKDVLVFTSAPLNEDLEVTGKIKAHIQFASDRPQTDLIVHLTDVYPDGKSILIADGLLSLKAQNGKTKLFSKGYDIDLWSTSLVFAKGHRIRISITSSNYPRYEKNLNGQTAVKALNHVLIDPKHPSYITLPVVRSGSKWLSIH